MKPKINNILREKIKSYIKNQIDISDLIRDYDIAGEDLSYAIIKDFNRPGENFSGAILANAIIGEEGKETNICNAIARNCNCRKSVWKGNIEASMIDARNSTFTDAYIPYFDYRYADLRGCDFCGAVFTIHTPKAYGAKFSTGFFKDLAAHWDLVILTKQEYEALKNGNTSNL